MQKQHSLTLHLGTTEGNNAVTLSGQEASRHRWIMGTSGSGKSVFIVWLILVLLKFGVTVIGLDPHGDVCRLALSLLDSSGFFKTGGDKAFNRLWFVDLGRQGETISFNVLRLENTTSYRAASDFLNALTRAFPSSSSGSTPLMDNVIQYTAFVLAETGQPATAFQRFLLDKSFRDRLLANIYDRQIVQFFEFTLAKENSSSLIASTMRRLDLLTFSPIIRNALSSSENRLDFRKLYDTGTSCLISLEGCSESEKRLLGCLAMTQIEQSLLSRLELPPEKRTPVHIFVDEAPLFIAQSESAFTTILEQARKAGAVLSFVHQGLHQLPRNMAGALQGCLPILLRAGNIDSSELTSRFFRPIEEPEPNLFDLFSLPSRSYPSVFASAKNANQARMILEQLRRQEAICVLPEGAVKFTTPFLPTKIDQKRLAAIEDTYAKRLLVPWSKQSDPKPIANGTVASHLSGVKRRVPASSPVTPFQTYVGASSSEADVQGIVQLYGFVTVSHVAKLLSKSDTAARNKLKKLVDAGLITVSSVPSVTGKTPLCYSVKAKKHLKGQLFLDHALASTDILLNTVMLPGVTIIDLKADTAFKVAPLQEAGGSLVPDAQVRLTYKGYEYNLYYEIDRNTEPNEKIVAKLKAYQALVASYPCMAVCFCVVEGGDLRVKTLRNWALHVVPENVQELFLFAAIDLHTLTPETLLTSPLWVSVNNSSPTILLAG